MTSNPVAHEIVRRTLGALVAGVFVVSGGSVEAMPRGDWMRVESLPPGIPTRVRLHTADPVSGRRQITGLFESSGSSTITLMLRDGQSKTIEQSHVRKIVARRQVVKRYAGWIALGATVAATGLMSAKNSDPPYPPLYFSAIGSSALGFWLNKWRRVYRAPKGSHN